MILGDGGQAGVVTIEEARSLAQQSGLDLLLLSETAVPPVCKLVDFGQFKYQQQKKEKLNRKNTKSQVTKEIKIGPKISEHDFQVKLDRGRDFLVKRFKVKVSIVFRGREIIHMELGRVLVNRYIQNLSDLGIASDIVQAGKSLVVIINPK